MNYLKMILCSSGHNKFLYQADGIIFLAKKNRNRKKSLWIDGVAVAVRGFGFNPSLKTAQRSIPETGPPRSPSLVVFLLSLALLAVEHLIFNYSVQAPRTSTSLSLETDCAASPLGMLSSI